MKTGVRSEIRNEVAQLRLMVEDLHELSSADSTKLLVSANWFKDESGLTLRFLPKNPLATRV